MQMILFLYFEEAPPIMSNIQPTQYNNIYEEKIQIIEVHLRVEKIPITNTRGISGISFCYKYSF